MDIAGLKKLLDNFDDTLIVKVPVIVGTYSKNEFVDFQASFIEKQNNNLILW